MIRPIAISLSPNLEKKDILLSLELILSPHKFFWGDSIKLLELWFRRFFNVSFAISFTSARGALYVILKTKKIGIGDEVLLQAFTCVAVPNAVLATGANPIYVDISNDLNMSFEDFSRKITKKTKAIIVQHTFGIPADMDKIISLAKKNNIFVIEDCAHIIGGKISGKKIGTFGDASIFSFGRDKAFSSVFGGIAITNNKILGNEIRKFQRQQEYPTFFWIFQQLFHPIAFLIILPLYNCFSIGRILLFILQKFSLLSFPVLASEKKGKTSPIFTKKLPNALACLILNQLQRLDIFNSRREEFTSFYSNNLLGKFQLPYKGKMPLLRYPLIVNERDKFIDIGKDKNIFLGKWYSEVIDPKGVNFSDIHYEKGSCPNAESISKKIINLPTYPTMSLEDVKKVTDLVKKYA